MNDRERRLRERIDTVTDQRDQLVADSVAHKVELEHNLAELQQARAELRKSRARLRERTVSRDLWKIRYARLRADRETRAREQRRLEAMVVRLRPRRGKDAA